MANECSGSGVCAVFMAFLMGAAIGGGVALLAAPRSGKDTRDKIRGAADDVRDRVKEYTEDAEARLRDAVEEGRELLKEKADMIKAAVEAGKGAMEAERAKAQGQA